MLIRDELARRYGLAECVPLTMATESIRDEMLASRCGLREAVLNLLAECQEEHRLGLFFEKGNAMETTEMVDRWDVVICQGSNMLRAINPAWLGCQTWEAMSLISGFNRKAKSVWSPLRAKLVKSGQRYDVEVLDRETGLAQIEVRDCDLLTASEIQKGFEENPDTNLSARLLPRKS